MKHYEYATRFVSNTEIEKMLNQMDGDGWEFCGIGSETNICILIFRKEKE